jgi:hypothetical protein
MWWLLPKKMINKLESQYGLDNDFDLNRIEKMINELIQYLNLDNKWKGKCVKELNAMDIDIFSAILSSHIERQKAVQISVLFTAIILNAIIIYISKIHGIYAIGFAAVLVICGMFIESRYKSGIANYTILKELLTRYKKEKF